MKKNLVLILTLILLTAVQQARAQEPRLNEGNIKEVVAAMTLEEKAALVVGTGMRFGRGPVVGETQQKVPGAAGTTVAVERLGIPSVVLADGPAGLRISPYRGEDSTKTYFCTAFPVGTLLASSWDETLVTLVGDAMGNEMLEYGVDILLAPALNIQRNPLCGRNFEYYSEDPLISGRMATAITRGVQEHGVGVSLKHFVANNAETNRMALNTIVTERALREIYLRGFEMAVRAADPWTVMSSYNLINGTPASQSHELLTDILRTDWGFGGLVMTDWFGGTDAVEQMKAGNDLLMPGRPEQTQAIINAVKEGTLPVEVLDQNVGRILGIVVKTPAFKNRGYSNEPDLEEHARIARRAGSEGMVLLRNEGGTLPLATGGGTVACFGNTSYEIITGGTGSGDVNEAYSVSLTEGLSGAGFVIDAGLESQYREYMAEIRASRPQRRGFMPAEPIPEMDMEDASIREAAERTGMALVTIGRNSGEFRDRTVEDFYLSDAEQALIRNVSDIYHSMGKKVIVILNIGGVIETASWKDRPDAILLAWQAGQETGNAIADVLSGRVNPSGKLATTFPVKYEDNPSAATFPGKVLPTEGTEGGTQQGFMRAAPSEIVYDDDIYVGYRYFDAFDVEPSYEFGFGMSYTDFDYGKPSLSATLFDESMTVEIEVTNTGNMAGKEVVQLYLGAPSGSMNKPVRELKAFAKTGMLEPGESELVRMTLNPRDLCSFDSEQSSWRAEQGTYDILVGSSSKNIRQKASFLLEEPITVEKVTRSLLPEETIDVLVHE